VAVRVVLFFDDDNEAKSFVRSSLQSDVLNGDCSYIEDAKAFTFKVEAAYKAPTKFCDNADNHRKGKTSSAFTRGAKWGWWVCATCGKPTERWATGDIWHYSMGYNLLPTSVSPLERGHRSTAEWKEEELGLQRDGLDQLRNGEVRSEGKE
jgi:hypothetical protein